MLPLDISNINDEEEENTRSEPEDVVGKEILEKIDRALPADLRQNYLRMRSGEKLCLAERQAVEQFVLGLGLLNG
jgi:hypothetical protein